jgi:hypothetical protein
MQKKLVVFEFAEEIEAFMKAGYKEELGRQDTLVLALLPGAQATLKRKKIPFLNSTEFFDKSSHENLLVFSNQVIEIIRKSIRIHDDLGVREGYSNSLIFQLRPFLHYLLFLTEVISRCVEKHKIEKIFTADWGRESPFNYEPLLGDKECYVGPIASLVCKRYGVKQVTYGVKNEGRFFNESWWRLGELIRNKGKKMAFTLSGFLLQNAAKGRKVLLSPSRDYNMPRVVEEFRRVDSAVFPVYLFKKRNLSWFKDMFFKKKNWDLFSIPGCGRKSAIFEESLASNLERLEEILASSNGPLCYKGVSLNELVLKRIKFALFPYLTHLYHQTVCVDRLLRRVKPILIVSQHSRNLAYNLGELSRKYGIPSLLISHGSHTLPKSKFEKIEWGEHSLGLMNTAYEYLAVQTPWAKAFLEELPTQSKEVITGPLLFAREIERSQSKEELKEKIIPQFKDRYIVLHASTPKVRRAMRFYVYETVDEYIKNVNDLIRAVEKVKNAYLVIRFRPAPTLSEEDFKALLEPSDCYGVYSGGIFDDYLLMSDLLVSYSSTTIEEALQNRVPVLQYDSQGKYCHIPATHLQPGKTPQLDSCYFVSSVEDLPWALNWIQENQFKIETSNDLWQRHIFKPEEKTSLKDFYKQVVDTNSL